MTPVVDASQTLFNIVIFIAGGGVTWWVKTIWESVSSLQREDAVLAEKVHNIELLVAGDYVKKDELARAIESFMRRIDQSDSKMERRLDAIDSKLDTKQDKAPRPYG